MRKTGIIIFLLVTFLTLSGFCQGNHNKDIPDSILLFEVGIYYNIDEFLNNSPGISLKDERIYGIPRYRAYTENSNEYYISYFDNSELMVTLSLNEIWGFFDGRSFFLSHDGKPFELRKFGPISKYCFVEFLDFKETIKRQRRDRRLGIAPKSKYSSAQVVYYDFEDKKLFELTKKNVKEKISKDSKLYKEYIAANRKMKWLLIKHFYITKYCKRNPISITLDGIKF